MLKIDWTDILGIKRHVDFVLTFKQKYVYDLYQDAFNKQYYNVILNMFHKAWQTKYFNIFLYASNLSGPSHLFK